MKILFISNGYPPRQWAGTETYTAGIAQELDRQGHEVQVLCGGDWQEGPEYWNGYTDEFYHDIPIRRLNFNWTKAPDPFRYLYADPVVAEFLSGYLDELQPDLVHVTSCDILSASILGVVKEAGLPLVLSLTDFWFLCPRWNLLRSDGENCTGVTTDWECLSCNLYDEKVYNWPNLILPEAIVSRVLTTFSKYPILTRQRGLRGMAGDMADRKEYLLKVLELPDYRITASTFVRDIFLDNGVVAPIKVQAYGHDLSWLDDYTGKTPSPVIRFGFIGQISHSKGVHLLLQAVRFLEESGYQKEMNLSIYGDLGHDPTYSEMLQDLASNMPDVQFKGTYSHDQSAEIFAGIDILVVPSLWFDFPLVIREAFASNTPVITTNLGGMAEAVEHEISGLLFERDDAEDLARQLQRIIDEPQLLEYLQDGLPPVKSIAEEVGELQEIYYDLMAEVSQPLS